MARLGSGGEPESRRAQCGDLDLGHALQASGGLPDARDDLRSRPRLAQARGLRAGDSRLRASRPVRGVPGGGGREPAGGGHAAALRPGLGDEADAAHSLLPCDVFPQGGRVVPPRFPRPGSEVFLRADGSSASRRLSAVQHSRGRSPWLVRRGDAGCLRARRVWQTRSPPSSPLLQGARMREGAARRGQADSGEGHARRARADQGGRRLEGRGLGEQGRSCVAGDEALLVRFAWEGGDRLAVRGAGGDCQALRPRACRGGKCGCACGEGSP